MAIKAFDSLRSLGEWFDGEVFQGIGVELLYVFSRQENQWYCYKWSTGRREIALVEPVDGDLPLVIQVYPSFA